MRRFKLPTSSVIVALTILHLVVPPTHAAVDPVSVQIPEAKAYTGQRLPFYVELRSRGSFGGATSFTVPQVPETLIVKVGNPVVSSEQIEGESWFVQTHEFALFSQRDGNVRVPTFPVQFGTREGFSGPVNETQASVPAVSVEIERPPGTNAGRFLVTTDSFSVEEKWDPLPGEDVETGAVFKRTISQRAENMTGMALAPAPTTVPDGIRVYPGNPEVTDKTERGEFSGQRVETVTYLVEQPGNLTLPAIRFDWWNPATGKLESKTLPAVTFIATTPPDSTAEQSPASPTNSPLLWALIALVVVALGWFYRRRIASSFSRLRDRIDPPERRSARALLHACKQNDALAAARALYDWERLQSDFSPTGELRVKILELHRHLYGKTTSPASWNGAALASAFRHRFANTPVHSTSTALPPLNP